MDAVFGISLGTASSSIAASKGNKVEVLANHAGERVTPTLVTYQDNETIIGRSAKQCLYRNTKNTASHMSQLIGKDYDDADVRRITSSLTCEVRRAEDGSVCYVLEVDGKEKLVPVSDSLTHILSSLFETAGSFSSSSVKAVVAAVPANYTPSQRNALRLCAEAAGFEVMRIISEPAAICLAHGIGQNREKSYALVYNLGAHTLSLSLLLVTSGMYCEVVTRCVEGVGGRECDEVIANFLANEFERQWKVSVHDNKKCHFKLLAAAESAKHALSTVQTATVHLESLYDGLDFTYSLSRGRFEGLCIPIFRRCVDTEVLSELLSEGGVSKTQLSHVVLAGGSCKILHLQQLLSNEFPTSEFHLSPPPDEAVAIGCALQAAIMQEKWERERGGGVDGEEGMDVTCAPYDLWIVATELQFSEQLLSSLTPLPCQRTRSLSLPPLKAAGDVYCLELWEKSTNHEREIAKICVPVSTEDVEGDDSEGVKVTVTIVWMADSVVTISTSKQGSDWTCTIPLVE